MNACVTPPPTGVITEAKNTSGSALMTPSAVPALVYERIRPLTNTTNWFGPTVPIESGGNAPVSASVGPSNESAAVCTLRGCGVANGAFAGKREIAGASGFGCNWLRSSPSSSCSGRGLRGGAAAWRCMMASVRSVLPAVAGKRSPEISDVSAGEVLPCANAGAVGVNAPNVVHTNANNPQNARLRNMVNSP